MTMKIRNATQYMDALTTLRSAEQAMADGTHLTRADMSEVLMTAAAVTEYELRHQDGGRDYSKRK